MDGYLFGYFIGLLIHCVIFGVITRAIAQAKGYDGGFAWGFFLGAIGIVVVAVRPSINQTHTPTDESREYWNRLKDSKPSENGWKCVCGQLNSYGLTYCTRCRRSHDESKRLQTPKVQCHYCGANNNQTNEYCFACGRSLAKGAQETTMSLVAQQPVQQAVRTESQDIANLDALKKLAELRDLGILTDEEYQEKKKAIMKKI